MNSETGHAPSLIPGSVIHLSKQEAEALVEKVESGEECSPDETRYLLRFFIENPAEEELAQRYNNALDVPV